MASLHKVDRSPYWHCFFTLPDGRRTHRSTGETDKRKAWAVCNQYASAAELGRQGRFSESRARQTISDIFAVANQEKLPSANVEDFLASWLQKKELELAETSHQEYSRIAAEFLTSLGAKRSRPVDAVTVKDIVAFRSKLAKRVGPATVNKSLKILKGGWAQAVREGLVQSNVFGQVELLKVTPATRRAFTMDELRAILAVCDDEWRGIVLCGLYTGQRLMDVARLTWSQIDLQNAEIRFRTQKTGKVLVIPMAPPLHEYFLDQAGDQRPTDPVFATSHRAPGTTQSRRFRDILASVGLVAHRKHSSMGKGRAVRRQAPDLSFHCLRHTATSLLKNAGVSDVVARTIIGHDSPAVSEAYTHIETSTLRAAVSRMPNIS